MNETINLLATIGGFETKIEVEYFYGEGIDGGQEPWIEDVRINGKSIIQYLDEKEYDEISDSLNRTLY